MNKKTFYINKYNVFHEDLSCNNVELEKYNRQYYNYISNLVNSNKELDINEINVKKYLIDNGYKELILKVVDDCNLRCEYCIYSDNYNHTNSYSNKYMSFNVAKLAVDEYFSKIDKANKYYKIRPCIAFYGGEPLLNSVLIKDVIEYINLKYADYDVLYTITTNGILLLDQNISDFLKENKVNICLSLDGYEENHNRSRKSKNGENTYEMVLDAVNNYFDNYKYIYSLCCIDYGTDLKKLYNFYKSNDRINKGKIPHLLRISFINDVNTIYFNRFEDKQIEKFNKDLNELIELYINKSIRNENDWFLDLFIGEEIIRFIDRPKFITNGFYMVNGACVPGQKIYVNTLGDYSICEKICIDDLKIGDVYKGLDIDKIVNIMIDYNNLLENKCGQCPVSSLCTICYTHLISKDKIGLSKKHCENKLSSASKLIEIYNRIERENPGFYNELIHRRLRKNYKEKLDGNINISEVIRG